jgi:glycosyltransferase involved in cell wall biosynthesis
VYLTLARAVGLYRGAVWQATSEQEAADIRRWFGSDTPVLVAPNLSAAFEEGGAAAPGSPKLPGRLRIIFLSRLSPKKNLLGALQSLPDLKGEVRLNIYGPIDDPAYWARCQHLMKRLPPNIEVRYHGTVPPAQVAAVMQENDLFFLPTLSENFGHVILEALAAGLPVLISDQTPWRGLRERAVGWDIPLPRADLFRAALQHCVEMGSEEHRAWSRRARDYGMSCRSDPTALERMRALFRQAA